MKIEEKFIDGVGNISVQSAIARIELTRLDKLPLANEEPILEPDSRLVMSVDTLLRLYQGLGEVVNQLEARGLVSKKNMSEKLSEVNDEQTTKVTKSPRTKK
jgi:hypothetical protein